MELIRSQKQNAFATNLVASAYAHGFLHAKLRSRARAADPAPGNTGNHALFLSSASNPCDSRTGSTNASLVKCVRRLPVRQCAVQFHIRAPIAGTGTNSGFSLLLWCRIPASR